MPTVWFMVDDTDSRLNYTGDSRGFWSPVPSMISDSETGPTYNNTLHSAIGNTSVSFHFNGSSKFGAYGSLVGLNASVLESPFCAIECTLDGAPTEVFQQTTITAATNNNVLACRNIADNSTNHSSSGEHELIISVTYFSNPTGYWSLDYITYESLVNPAIDGEILQVGNLDVANGTDYNMLTIGPGWGLTGPARPGGKFLPKAFQSNMTIKLNGTSLSLYGDNFGGVPNATYKVDDLDLPTLALENTKQ
ncbi:hypothetical protein BT96DRAFT_168639 [Gymnopus androsaceus JB14]|uniref:Uncharacterized protein n=1 Tax=Gymnopus androsaceus JB14 TaxID=1447944 RepID=A0A6A4GBF1_9AGAR|nr:hypothetical protein BT96DRAFT_168639 [Gymnopus androsaceus JB14]